MVLKRGNTESPLSNIGLMIVIVKRVVLSMYGKVLFTRPNNRFARFSPDSHFGSFYPQNLVLDPQKVRDKGPEQCIYDQSKMIFIYLWICILMYFWFKRQELSIFWQ